ncbi:MAG: hypothetical protein WBI40_06445 [Methylococcaceae bacterium]
MKTTNPLLFPWFITAFAVTLLSISFIFVHFYGAPFQQPLAESERIFWRTMFYILAILILPLTNLLRHIFLRLNQTMPLLVGANLEKTAQIRYALTVTVSQSMMILIGWFGGMIFYFGDVLNSFHILTGLAVLGTFLYRPKNAEYQQIIDALTDKQDNEND